MQRWCMCQHAADFLNLFDRHLLSSLPPQDHIRNTISKYSEALHDLYSFENRLSNSAATMATVLPPLKDTPMSPPPMSLRQDSHQGNCPDLRITEYMVEDLWQMIKKSSDYGATPDTIGGMSRLALTEDDASFRAWFKDEALSMGCEVRVDRVGNMFAVLPGRNRSLPPIGIGSHLDTQPCGNS